MAHGAGVDDPVDVRAQGATGLERLPVGARLVLVAMLAAGVVGVGVALARPDGPWCSDEGDGSCPAEVRYDDRMYAVTCTDRIAASLPRERLGVVFHDGVEEAERTAWSVDSLPVEQVIVLADQRGDGCPGTEIAYGGLSEAEAPALLRP
jgi:hypothetical protein